MMPTRIEPKPLTHDPDADVAALLAALGGRTDELPVDALNELRAHNERLIATPTQEIEATLRRQTLLLEGMVHAYLRKSTIAKMVDHQATFANVALKSHTALLQTLGALRSIDEARRDAEAIDADAD